MKNYHPSAIAIYYGVILAITMFSNSPVILGISLLASTLYVVYLKGMDSLKTVLLLLAFVVVISGLMNGIFTHNGATVLFYLGGNRITLEAFVYGFAMALMIVSVLIWFMSFGEIMTSDKLIHIFGKLAPVIGLTISMIFRFVPLLKRRYRDIRMGQISLGRGDVKGPINILKQKVKEISILISWSLEASIESADSMSARGYGLPGRTGYVIYKFSPRDYLVIGLSLIFGLVVAATYYFGALGLYYYPEIRPKASVSPLTTGLSLFSFTILAFMPLILELQGDLQWKKSA